MMGMLNKMILTLGHVYCGIVGVMCDSAVRLIEAMGRTVIGLMEALTGTQPNLPQFPQQRFHLDPVYEKNAKDGVLEEDATKANSPFPLDEKDLVDKCKAIIRSKFGCTQPDLLAEDFLFIFPVVGPLKKNDFIEVFSSFKMDESLTGSPNYFGFSLDPMEPNRVWFFTRGEYKHTGDLKFGPKTMKATGTTITNPPQVLSMSFNTEGQCYKFTGGYSVDRTVGNTGGLGGLFGILHALGSTLPFREGQPWQPSLGMSAYVQHLPIIPKVWKSDA